MTVRPGRDDGDGARDEHADGVEDGADAEGGERGEAGDVADEHHREQDAHRDADDDHLAAAEGGGEAVVGVGPDEVEIVDVADMKVEATVVALD